MLSYFLGVTLTAANACSTAMINFTSACLSVCLIVSGNAPTRELPSSDHEGGIRNSPHQCSVHSNGKQPLLAFQSLTTSPPERVQSATSAAKVALSRMNRTLPSAIAAFAPPVWKP